MSSADASSGQQGLRRLKSRRALSLLATAACVVTFGACSDAGGGFRPLYGSIGTDGVAADQKLAAIEFAPIPGRVGQRIRNELIFQSTGGGLPLPPEYRLDVAVRESVASTLVKIDGNAQGQVYNLDASFQLIRISDKTVVAKGVSYGRAGYERMTSIFSNVRAREDAENRAAKTVGEELRSRLLAYLSRPA